MSLIALAQAAEAAAEPAAESGFMGFISDAETWVAITFVLVVIGLAKPVFRALTAALDVRREKIRTRIDDAEKLHAEAQELLASYQKKQHEATQEAQAILARAREDADRIAAEGARNLEALLKRREEQALERLAQAETEALREVKDMAVEIAISATQRLLADNIDPMQANALVETSIKDLNNRLN